MMGLKARSMNIGDEISHEYNNRNHIFDTNKYDSY